MMDRDYVSTLKLNGEFEQLFKPNSERSAASTQEIDVEDFLKTYSNELFTIQNPSEKATQEIKVNSENQIQEIFIKAALSGNVLPESLLTGNTSEDKAIILSRVKGEFMIYAAKENMEWRLRQTKREQVLQDLTVTGNLLSRIQEPLPITDEFGQMLRRVLGSEKRFDTKQMTDAELLLLCSVVESLGSVNTMAPESPVIKAELRQRSLLSDYQILAEHFVGRETEMAVLNNFVKDQQRHPWDGQLLTGQGGAGKSAIVARLSQMLLSPKTADVIILDFDRPGLNATNTKWMDEEVSRQLSGQHPEIASSQSYLRAQLRTQPVEESFIGSSSESEQFENSRVSKGLLDSLSGSFFQRTRINP